MTTPLRTYRLYWSPEGRLIAEVQARSERAAKRKAPLPYRRFLGEIYADMLPASYRGSLTDFRMDTDGGSSCWTVWFTKRN